AQPSYREFRPQVLGGQRTLAQKLPDLVIVSATPAGDCTAAYANINVTVTIKNIGKGPAVMPEPLAWAPWVAVWDKGSQDFWHLPYVTWIASGAPAQLLPNKTATFVAGGPMRRVTGGDFTIGVHVDPNNWILETNEANNVMTLHCK